MEHSETEKTQRDSFLRAVASDSSCPSLEKLSAPEAQEVERESTLDDESRGDSARRPDDTNREQTTSESTEDEKDEKDEEEEYPSGWRLTLITIGLCLCVFCTALVCNAAAFDSH